MAPVTMAFIALVLSLLLAYGAAGPLRPVLFTPGAGGSVLEVTVSGQTYEKGCPSNANYQIFMYSALTNIDPVCAHKFLRLQVDTSTSPPRFSNLPGVTVRIPGDGTPDCLPPYYQAPMVQRWLAAGYTPGKDLRVACWDTRLVPDVKDPGMSTSWLDRTVPLIERLYAENGGSPVLLVGYSNGAYYNKYLLDQRPQSWIDKYIAGYVSLHGNLAGMYWQVGAVALGADLTSGLGLLGTEASFQSWPNAYASMPSPEVFGDKTVATLGGLRSYTAKEYDRLFKDMNRPTAQAMARAFVGKYNTLKHPGTNVYAILANTPMLTPGPQLLIPGLVPVPASWVIGDTVVTEETAAMFYAWKEFNPTKCQVVIQDRLGQSHIRVINAAAVVDDWLENVIKGWDVKAGCGTSPLKRKMLRQ